MIPDILISQYFFSIFLKIHVEILVKWLDDEEEKICLAVKFYLGQKNGLLEVDSKRCLCSFENRGVSEK